MASTCIEIQRHLLYIYIHITLFCFLTKKNTPSILKNEKQDVFVKHYAPDNGQFQRRPRSQGPVERSYHKK